jgi:4-hydroxybenzoate polyprenyltransferase
MLASLLGLAACALVLVMFNPAIALFALLPIIGLATYTPMKRRVWAGPIWNSWIVATLPLLGALAGKRGLDAPLARAMATAFFAYATFVLLGYLKDVEADRRTGYDTLPVRYGRRTTVAVSLVCALAAVWISWPTAEASLPGIFLWAGGAIMLVLGHVRAWGITSDRGAHPAITMGLRGYVALHLGSAVLLKPALLAVGLAMLVGFEIALARRPSREQV